MLPLTPVSLAFQSLSSKLSHSVCLTILLNRDFYLVQARSTAFLAFLVAEGLLSVGQRSGQIGFAFEGVSLSSQVL